MNTKLLLALVLTLTVSSKPWNTYSSLDERWFNLKVPGTGGEAMSPRKNIVQFSKYNNVLHSLLSSVYAHMDVQCHSKVCDPRTLADVLTDQTIVNKDDYFKIAY